MIRVEERIKNLEPGPLDGNRIVELTEDLENINAIEGMRVYVKELGYDMRYNSVGDWEAAEDTGSAAIITDFNNRINAAVKYEAPIVVADMAGATEYQNANFDGVPIQNIICQTTMGDLRTSADYIKKFGDDTSVQFGVKVYGRVIFQILKQNNS